MSCNGVPGVAHVCWSTPLKLLCFWNLAKVGLGGSNPLARSSFSHHRETRCVGPATGPSALPEPHLAAAIRRLFDGVDQAVQFDRGVEGWLAAFAVADGLGE